MNTESDPLERELRAFRPRPPSSKMCRGIAAELATAPRWPWRDAIAGGLAAAWVVVAAFLMRSPTPVPHPAPPEVVQLATASNPPPTVQAYRQALADSPEALDRLLAQHADRYGPPGTPLNLSRLLND